MCQRVPSLQANAGSIPISVILDDLAGMQQSQNMSYQRQLLVGKQHTKLGKRQARTTLWLL